MDKKQALPWKPARWQLAIDIGVGLNYLHAKKILHKDLKSHNILITQDLHAKIGDFGLSKIKSTTGRTYTYTGGGTLPWMAPELFNREVIKTKAVDVYAYGMVLWEIASRKEPFKDLDMQRIMAQIFQGNREEIPKDTPKVFADLIQSCWQQKPENRPQISAVLEILNKGAPISVEEPLDNTDETEAPSSFEPSEEIKKALSIKIGVSFGSEEFRKASKRYATSFKDGIPDKLWNIETDKVVKTFGKHKEAVLAFCPVGLDSVASASYDKEIKIWNLKTGECVKTLEGHAYGVYGLAALSNGNIASASQDKTIRVWDVKKGATRKTLEGHDQWVQTVAALPNNQIASGSYDNTIKIWDASSGECLATLEGHQYGIYALAALDGNRLASGSRGSADNTIKI